MLSPCNCWPCWVTCGALRTLDVSKPAAIDSTTDVRRCSRPSPRWVTDTRGCFSSAMSVGEVCSNRKDAEVLDNVGRYDLKQELGLEAAL